MKKYEKPIIKKENIILTDVITASSVTSKSFNPYGDLNRGHDLTASLGWNRS